MAIRLFDSLTRRKVELEPRRPPHVGLYVCGVTTYDLCHLGHARCYVVWDVVQRHLRSRGLEVQYVRNITDVDDKIINRAREMGALPQAFAERFIAEMYVDFDALGLARPDIEPRATEHIPEMITHIQRLIADGYAYPSEGDVYFAVERFSDYGELSGQSLDELKAGARVEVGERKRNPLDFALWKGAKPGEPSWESPWGPGRPGWHIECSAMSAKYLGDSFDLHAGGKDLVFPHHQNEIAQSCALTGRGTFARYWMHNGFLNLNAEKMSKSTGNFFTIREVSRHHEPEALRLFLLAVHYRSPINIDVEEKDGRAFFPGVAEAERRLDYFYTTLARLDALLDAGNQTAAPPTAKDDFPTFQRDFEEALDDDFNTAVALATYGEAATLANKLLDDPKALAKDVRLRFLFELRRLLRESMGRILGIGQRPPNDYLLARRARIAAVRGVDEREVEGLLEARKQARGAKDFARADEIRQQLGGRGIEVMDSPTGTSWRFSG